MHYVVGDIHNENKKLRQLLRQISFGADDHIYILGDLFDRGGEDADPVGVYFTVLELGERCTALRGNHDQWLAAYIRNYYSLSEREQERCAPYTYNSFDLMRQRLTPVDMRQLEAFINSLPLHTRLNLEQKEYLFAHAMTCAPGSWRKADYYLMGDWYFDLFVTGGIPEYISFCGHHNTGGFSGFPGAYCDGEEISIWHNEANNVYMMDCGCGFAHGRLACMCLETRERFYIDSE